ncbi:hypothetical protein JL720_4056 [Aureococcus anophagefferens]|nr:hypothetical protein JL720_4056 [Aureococcus anophagefferens]
MGDASELRGDTSETLDSGVSSSNVALGAGQDHEDALTAQQALWEAAAAGGIAALQAALETDGVDVDAARPADGMPALHLAAQKGSDACARSLLKAGADAALGNGAGRSALHVGASLGHWQVCVALLQEGGVNVDDLSRDGRAALSFAAERGHDATARELLRFGADAALADGAGRTALHFAVIDGSAACVARLRKHGAPLEARDEKGATPASLAEQLGDAEVLRALKGEAAPAPEAPTDDDPWRWVAVGADGKLAETAAEGRGLPKRGARAAAVMTNNFSVHELRRSTRGAFEREVGFDKVAGDGDEAKEKEMEEDPIMAEFRRQAAAKKESGANVDEKRALDDLKSAEGKIDALDAKADEFRAVADMRELALASICVSIFSRSHDLEQSIAELTKRLRASPSGPKLIESLENLRRQRHPAAKEGADLGRAALAAAELLDENRAKLPAWAPPPPQPVYARDDDEPPPPAKKTADRASELMKRLERSYDDKARAYAKKSAPVPEDVQRARREPEARPRRVLPMQEVRWPWRRQRRRRRQRQRRRRRAPPPPPPDFEDLAALLAAAGLEKRADVFEAEDADLEVVLEAHEAGDLMDLLKEIGLKATERMKIKRALNPPSRAA